MSCFPTRSLYIGGLDFRTTKHDVYRFFDNDAGIVEVRLCGRYGFVKFQSKQLSTTMMHRYNRTSMRGQRITLNYARRDDVAPARERSPWHSIRLVEQLRGRRRTRSPERTERQDHSMSRTRGRKHFRSRSRSSRRSQSRSRVKRYSRSGSRSHSRSSSRSWTGRETRSSVPAKGESGSPTCPYQDEPIDSRSPVRDRRSPAIPTGAEVQNIRGETIRGVRDDDQALPDQALADAPPRVLVRNLHPGCTSADLLRFASQAGRVTYAQSGLYGSHEGFLSFDDSEAEHRAVLRLSGLLLGGCPVSLSSLDDFSNGALTEQNAITTPNVIFLNLPPNCELQALSAFAEQAGDVAYVRVNQYQAGEGFVRYEHVECAVRAVSQLHGLRLGGHTVAAVSCGHD